MSQLNSHQRRLLFVVVMALLIGIGFKIIDRHRRAFDFDIKGMLDGYKYTTAIDFSTSEVKATTPAMQIDSSKTVISTKTIPKARLEKSGVKSNSAAKNAKELPAALIDINKADTLTLMTLPGIGPVLAGRIIAFRDSVGGFGKVSDLLKVKGIGDKKLAKIKPYLKF